MTKLYTLQKDVVEFRKQFGLLLPPRPCSLADGGADERRLFKQLVAHVEEEASELVHAAGRNDHEGIIDGVVDLCYVAIQLATAYGLNLGGAWEDVHAANMRKRGADATGKITKPPGWVGPSHAKSVQSQRVHGNSLADMADEA